MRTSEGWRPEWEQYIQILQDNVIPSLGCTEPISTAYATALAVELLNELPDQIQVYVSGNLMKNGMGVGVPGTGMVGLPIAAAAGAVGGDPGAGLEVLKNITPEHVGRAKVMLDSGQVSVQIKEVPEVLYSEVLVSRGEHHARVIIKDHHTQVVLKELDGKTVFSTQEKNDESHNDGSSATLSVASIYEFATQVPYDKIRFILNAACLNQTISAEGLSGSYGLKVGRTLQQNISQGLLSEDLITLAMMRSSAASDARMDGAMLPAMSNSGSGNQGIAATMPVVAVADHLGCGEEKLARALILSHLIAIYIKTHLDTLSAMCGATTAGTGASCGITWLLGGELEQVECAIFNMVGDIAGIFCDGAKACCSMKVSTSAGAAVKASLMAINNIRVSGQEGIIAGCVEETIDNLGLLGNQGMRETDRMILKIMTSKSV